jgi:hypothetical protein
MKMARTMAPRLPCWRDEDTRLFGGLLLRC